MILHHGPPWLHGLIQSVDDGSTGWTRTLSYDLNWLDSFEPGAPSSFSDLVASLLTTSKNALKARLRRAKTASILHQASQDDLTSLEAFQQEAFGSIGIPIGPQDPQIFVTCEKRDKSFPDKQALRTHQSKVHTVLSIANLYLGNATFCLACRTECHTTNYFRRHLQGQTYTKCLRTNAFWFPDPTGQQRAIDQNSQEPLKGITGNRQKPDPNTTLLAQGPLFRGNNGRCPHHQQDM